MKEKKEEKMEEEDKEQRGGWQAISKSEPGSRSIGYGATSGPSTQLRRHNTLMCTTAFSNPNPQPPHLALALVSPFHQQNVRKYEKKRRGENFLLKNGESYLYLGAANAG